MASSERHVRLFRNGRNQALRIPREFELEGDRLIVEPIRQGTPMGTNDLLISANALAEELTVVTAKVREFLRVRGLSFENSLENI